MADQRGALKGFDRGKVGWGEFLVKKILRPLRRDATVFDVRQK